MTGVLENKLEAIAEVCVRHGVVRLDAFGSALRDDCGFRKFCAF